MTREQRIAALLAEAAPLRLLDADDPAAESLPALVDTINKLRAEQEAEARLNPAEPVRLTMESLPEALRPALEREAMQRGIKFDGRTTDKKLATQIAAAMAS